LLTEINGHEAAEESAGPASRVNRTLLVDRSVDIGEMIVEAESPVVDIVLVDRTLSLSGSSHYCLCLWARDGKSGSKEGIKNDSYYKRVTGNAKNAKHNGESESWRADTDFLSLGQTGSEDAKYISASSPPLLENKHPHPFPQTNTKKAQRDGPSLPPPPISIMTAAKNSSQGTETRGCVPLSVEIKRMALAPPAVDAAPGHDWLKPSPTDAAAEVWIRSCLVGSNGDCRCLS